MQELSGSDALAEEEENNPRRSCTSKTDVEQGEYVVAANNDNDCVDDDNDGGVSVGVGVGVGEESDPSAIIVKDNTTTIERLNDKAEDQKEPDRCSDDDDKEEEQKEPIDASNTTASESTVAPQKRDNTKGSARVPWIASAISHRRISLNNDGEGNNATPRSHGKGREAAKSKKIAVQGLLYVVAFYITWLFPTISRITELVAGKNYFPIQFLDTFLIPLQGFLNFLIYIRPRFLIYRKLHVNDGFWKSLKIVVFENHDGNAIS